MKYFVGLLLVLLLSSCTDGDRMRQQLADLQMANQADSLLTNDSLALALCSYFDRHGTANEQMLAHYLLGRTYVDRGEYSTAVEAYNDAIGRADTTARDCDFAILSRVYTQKAQLWYNQFMPDKMIQDELMAMHYARLAKDTMQYLYCYGVLAEGYDMKNMPDSALATLLHVYRLYKEVNATEYAAGLCCSIANIYMNKHDYQRAASYLHEYETRTGLFHENGDIDRGKEIYYYCKGILCLGTSDVSQAERYFRKLHAVALTDDHKIAAFAGLQLCYQENFNKDSLVKYCNLKDSLANMVHNEVEMQKTLQVQSMYDYSHNERLAHQKEKEADRLKFILTVSVAIIALLLLMGVYVHGRNKDTRRLLEEKIRILSGYAINERLRESATAQHFYACLKDNPSHVPSLADWKELRNLIDHELPSFYATINRAGIEISDFEYDVCMLVKIQVASSDIARLKQCTPAYITQTRKRIYKKLFSKNGRADEFDEFILSLS